MDGLFAVDPLRVPRAAPLSHLSYAEAAELGYYGAKVLHPRTMKPCRERGIPIRLMNTFNHEHQGETTLGKSEIHLTGSLVKDCSTHVEPKAKAFSVVDRVSLVSLEGCGMMGVPGVVARLFSAVHSVGVNVKMITQGSSEHNVTFAVGEGEGESCKEAIER